MLGEVLSELAASAFGDAFSPSTNRGRAWLTFVLSVIAAGLQAALFAAVADPLRGPQWAFNSVVLGTILGIIALAYSGASLIRVEEHRGLSLISAPLAMFAAVAWALFR